MFSKTNVRSTDLKTVQILDHQDAIYGMQLDEVGQRLADKYHTYYAYDYRTMSYLMIFWSNFGAKVSGSVSFDKDRKARDIHFSMGHGLEKWFPPDWIYILPESLYRKLTETDIRHLDQWGLQTAIG